MCVFVDLMRLGSCYHFGDVGLDVDLQHVIT